MRLGQRISISTFCAVLSLTAALAVEGPDWSLQGFFRKALAEEGAAEKAAGEVGDAAVPSLEKLVQLNAEAIFGGEVHVDGQRFTARFQDNRLFEKLFRTRPGRGGGFVAHKDDIANTQTRNLLTHEAAGKFSVAGVMPRGTAISTFELGDDFTIQFKLRIPRLDRKAHLVWKYLFDGKKNYLQTDLMRNLAVQVVKGKPRGTARPSDRRLLAPAVAWFDKESKGVDVEVKLHEGKLTVHMRLGEGDAPEGRQKGKRRKKEADKKDGEDKEKPMVEVVALDGVDQLSAGKMAIEFANVNFLVSDLTISGKFSVEWAQARIAALEKQKQLVTEKAAAKEEQKDKPAPVKRRVARAANKKGPDLDKPDPEAEDDL